MEKGCLLISQFKCSFFSRTGQKSKSIHVLRFLEICIQLFDSTYCLKNALSYFQVMQTNVPQPFKCDAKGERSGHLSMPGGQWSQSDKYVSSDLHEHHYNKKSSGVAKDKKLRHSSGDVKQTPAECQVRLADKSTVRGGKDETYDLCYDLRNFSVPNIACASDSTNNLNELSVLGKEFPGVMFGRSSSMSRIHSSPSAIHNTLVSSSAIVSPGFQLSLGHHNNKFSSVSMPCILQRQYFTTTTSLLSNKAEDVQSPGEKPEAATQELTSRQKIQQAVKEYGTAVIVFHVTISLASLGFFYLLVSRYVYCCMLFFLVITIPIFISFEERALYIRKATFYACSRCSTKLHHLHNTIFVIYTEIAFNKVVGTTRALSYGACYIYGFIFTLKFCDMSETYILLILETPY